MVILFTILHVIVCLFLILVVLAQQGKGQDLASAFGGGGSQTAFGARGTATLLSKITAGAAVLFMVTSLALSYLRPAVSSQRSVVPETPEATETAPEAAPGEQPPASETAPEGTEGTQEPPSSESAQPPSEGESAPSESSQPQSDAPAAEQPPP